MSRRCSQLVVAGGLVLALFLPLVFDPWAALPFEPAKATFVRLVAAITLTLAVLCHGAAVARRADWTTRRLGQAPEALQPSEAQGVSVAATGLTALTLIYAAVLVAATVCSIDPPRSLWGAPDRRHGAVTLLAAVALSLALARALTSWRRVASLWLALLAGSVPVVVYGLAQAAGLDPLTWKTDAVSPVLSTLGRSNFLGAYLAVLLPLTLARLLLPAPEPRWSYGALLALQVACLLLTLARAAVLAALGGSLLLLGLLAWRWRSAQLIGVASVALAVGVGWLAATQVQTPLPAAPVAAQAAAPAFAELRMASVAARGIIWQTTWHLIPNRWLLGYGPETFAAVFRAHNPSALARYQASGVVVNDPHNLLLNELMAGGLLGLLALVAVVVGYYVVIWRAWRQSQDRSAQVMLAALLAAMTAWLIQAQFNPQVVVLIVWFWLLLALALASSRLATLSTAQRQTETF